MAPQFPDSLCKPSSLTVPRKDTREWHGRQGDSQLILEREVALLDPTARWTGS